MMTLSVKTDFSRVYDFLRTLPEEIGNKAMSSALNKTADTARAQMTREITRSYNVQASAVRSQLYIRRASARAGGVRLEVSLEAFGRKRKGRSMNVIHFLERSVTLAEGRRRRKAGTLRQLQFSIKRGQGKKPIAGSFVGNSGRTVFRRTGKARLPIEPVMTIDVPSMFNARVINEAVMRHIEQRFPEIFTRDARYYLNKAAK